MAGNSFGQEQFKSFSSDLTDGGSEFSARKEMEEFCDGSKSTTVFYCDSYSFWQKGACEKNHEYIRYICPKGSSFADLNDDKVRLMMNHIQSNVMRMLGEKSIGYKSLSSKSMYRRCC